MCKQYLLCLKANELFFGQAARRKQRKAAVLFNAAARQLGTTWRTKAEGYALLTRALAAAGYRVPQGKARTPRPHRATESTPPKSYSTLTVERERVRINVASKEFLNTAEWRKLRMEVIKERGARCECCGARPRKDNDVVLNVDHIKPRRKYPELALVKSNLQVLCGACNHGKGNWDETDWRQHDAAITAPPAPPRPPAPADQFMRVLVRKLEGTVGW